MTLIVLAWVPRGVSASPILITESATVSGTLNGVAFTNATLTLSETTDTLTVTSSGGVSTTGNAAIFASLTGFNSFLIAGHAFSGPSSVGLQTNFGSTGSPDILDVAVATGGFAFGAPASFSGTPIVQPGDIYTTTAAGLVLNSASGTATFTVTATTPEPASAVLCGLAGVLALAGRRILRR